MSEASETRADDPNRLVEVPPSAASTLKLWLLLLGGPLIWIAHFMVVYLLAEASCTALEADDMAFVGTDVLTASVVGATVVAAAASVAAAVYSWRGWRHGEGDVRYLGSAGALLAVLSLIAVLAVGIPALVIEPC